MKASRAHSLLTVRFGGKWLKRRWLIWCRSRSSGGNMVPGTEGLLAVRVERIVPVGGRNLGAGVGVLVMGSGPIFKQEYRT